MDAGGEKHHRFAWQRIAKASGVQFDYEEYLPFKSDVKKSFPIICKGGQNIDRTAICVLLGAKTEILRRNAGIAYKNDIVSGLKNFARYLHDKKITCAVTSASADSKNATNRLGLRELFDVFADGNALLPNKSKPEIYLCSAKISGVASNKCVVP